MGLLLDVKNTTGERRHPALNGTLLTTRGTHIQDLGRRAKKNHMTVQNCHVEEIQVKLRVLFIEMLGVFFIEFLNSSCGIDELLLAGKKGVAGGTDLNLNGLVYGTELNFIAAGALCIDLMIYGMDIGFHYSLSLQKTCSHQAIINFTVNNFTLLPVLFFF